MNKDFDNEDEGLEFDVLTEYEKNELSAKLSDEVIITSIMDQINKPILTEVVPNNVLNIFNERYTFITRFYPNNEDLISKCKFARTNLYKKVLKAILTKFDITSELESYMDDNPDDETVYDCIESLYTFFILYYKENLSLFLTTYIKNSEESLISNYRNESNKKDLMFKSLKKVLGNSDSIHIIYNLDGIINSLVETFNQGEFIIHTIIETDIFKFDYAYIKELLIENRFDTYINTSFTDNFFKPLKDEDYKYELLTPIRNSLIMNYKQDKKEEEDN
jgi:hypothetical protein